MALGFFIASPRAQLVDPGTFVKALVSVSPDPVPAGEAFELTITLQIKKGIHLQAHKPTLDYLIPTALTLDKSEGIEFGEVRYPEPKPYKFAFSETPLLVFEHEIKVTVPARAAAEAPQGKVELTARLQYQGCDDKVCFRPVYDFPIKIPLTIAAPASTGETPDESVAPPEPTQAQGPPLKRAAFEQPRAQIAWLPYRKEILEEAARAKKPAMVDFTAEWCAPCQKMEQTTFRDPRVVAASEEFVMVKVDLTHESAENERVRRKLKVVGPPTYLFYDRAGRIIGREEGYMAAERFLQFLQAARDGARPPAATGLENRLRRQLERFVEGDQLMWALVICFLGGLALNLTPCVFPMVAITVSYFGGQMRRRVAESFGYAAVYFAGVVMTYSLLGLVAASTGAMFGALLQKPAVLIGLAALLVALALSMFGLYEFRLPQPLLQQASGLGRKAGHVGVFFLGAALGVVAAPCVGPFLVGLLLLVGQMGDLWRGWWLFFALSSGLGLPYLVLGTYSGLLSKLPRAGRWMLWVKALFGVVLLALAAWLVRPLWKL